MPDAETSLSPDEQQMLRTAAFGAVQLYSVAYPGLISTARQNIAGAKVLSSSTGPIGQLLAGKNEVRLQGSAADVAAIVLPALSQTVSTLSAKEPEQLHEFRRIVSTALRQAADVTGGANPAQQEMLERINTALHSGEAFEANG
jgi:hypothetical protein